MSEFIHFFINKYLIKVTLINRKLTKYCLREMGDFFQILIYSQYDFPLKVALQNNIKFFLWILNTKLL